MREKVRGLISGFHHHNGSRQLYRKTAAVEANLPREYIYSWKGFTVLTIFLLFFSGGNATLDKRGCGAAIQPQVK
jgi:hypothetical protein